MQAWHNHIIIIIIQLTCTALSMHAVHIATIKVHAWRCTLGTSKNSAIPSISDGSTLAESNQEKHIMLNNFINSCSVFQPIVQSILTHQTSQSIFNVTPIMLAICLIFSLDLSKSSGLMGFLRAANVIRSTA